LRVYKEKMLEQWETMPESFVSSSETGEGKNEILHFIENVNRKK
jgi:GTP-binding protein